MFDFLIRSFIKNSNNISDPAVRRNYGALSGSIGLILNIILSFSKIIAGTLFNSIAVIADGINNLSDAGSSIVTLIGFKLSGKPADRDHPFGHARIEYLTGFILGIAILFVGIEIIRSSADKIINPQPAKYSTVMFVILAVSIAVKLWLSRFYARIAEIISSSAIKAASADSMNDVLATSAVLFGAIVSSFTGFEIDGFMGIGIAFFVLWSGVQILKSLLGPILGQMPDRELVDSIEKKILSYDGILNIHDLVIHNYGPKVYFATVHAEVDAKASFIKSHDMIDCIERDCARDLNINLVIHMDPIIIDDEEVNSLKKMTEEIVTNIDKRFTIHDFRIVKGDTHTNLIFDVAVPAEINTGATKLIIKIESAIKAKNPNYYPVITIDKNYVSTCINGSI
ncbi:MAG: cation diffusion facilitator family transporter [Synergistaceae bacterium]|nr:cation diffusion facilitator family transporter [Synergistaceae bacterium]